ncbi:MAG: hypothetical protein GX993_05075 [Bacteroidales bacterium]|nr:hypothetical protein [Bacteroidales bacterium]
MADILEAGDADGSIFYLALVQDWSPQEVMLMEGIPGVLPLKCFGGVAVLYRRPSHQAFKA